MSNLTVQPSTAGVLVNVAIVAVAFAGAVVSLAGACESVSKISKICRSEEALAAKEKAKMIAANILNVLGNLIVACTLVYTALLIGQVKGLSWIDPKLAESIPHLAKVVAVLAAGFIAESIGYTYSGRPADDARQECERQAPHAEAAR